MRRRFDEDEDYWEMDDHDQIHFPLRGRASYLTTFDKGVQLNTMPHYTDEQFTGQIHGVTVFGKPAPNITGWPHLVYVYGDRLFEWYHEKWDAAIELANGSGATLRSCRWYEVLIGHLLGQEIEIEHIVAGVQRFNGFSWNCFGYKVKEEK